jgi:hypothetical protein
MDRGRARRPVARTRQRWRGLRWEDIGVVLKLPEDKELIFQDRLTGVQASSFQLRLAGQ